MIIHARGVPNISRASNPLRQSSKVITQNIDCVIHRVAGLLVALSRYLESAPKYIRKHGNGSSHWSRASPHRSVVMEWKGENWKVHGTWQTCHNSSAGKRNWIITYLPTYWWIGTGPSLDCVGVGFFTSHSLRPCLAVSIHTVNVKVSFVGGHFLSFLGGYR